MKGLVTILLAVSGTMCNGQNKILIAAASDLKFALDSIVLVFRNTHAGQVDVTYGSSGKLTEQILNGAPFDLLLSADVAYPEMLRKKGQAGSDIYPYARGRIVLWSRKLDPRDEGMRSLLNQATVKIAVANPRHAPYGKRAIECLEYYGLMKDVESRLVFGENISQAAQFVSGGAADIAIIALSIALSPNLKKETNNYFLIPEESHRPLVQGAVITRKGKAKPLSRTFFDFLQDPRTREVLKHYGFSTP